MHEAIQAFNMHMTPYEYPEYIDTNPAEQKSWVLLEIVVLKR